jgi:hypothetical protein
MQLFIKTLTGKIITLQANRWDTIESLKIRLANDMDGSLQPDQPDRVRLITQRGGSAGRRCKGFSKVLENNSLSLADCKIRSETTLFVLYRFRGPQPTPDSSHAPPVCFPDGEDRVYPRFRTVLHEMQEQIREQDGVHISLQRLTYAGRVCNGTETLDDLEALGDGNMYAHKFHLEVLPVSCATQAAFDDEVRAIVAAAEAKAATRAAAEAKVADRALELDLRAQDAIDRLACNDATMASVELSGVCVDHVCCFC